MNVVKDMALNATRFAKKETKLALLSLALLSLASCTSDPKSSRAGSKTSSITNCC